MRITLLAAFSVMMRSQAGYLAIVFSIVASIFPCASFAYLTTSVYLLEHGQNSVVTLASSDSPLDCERPRINDLGEVVWTQRTSLADEIWTVLSNKRGAITSGYVTRDPDINNEGEIIWRYGDGGGGPNGIESNTRGLVLSSVHLDPYYDTPRINNSGEIIAARNGGTTGVWSSVRGYLATPGVITLDTEVNDYGEVAYTNYYFADPNTAKFAIYSTARGAITDGSVWTWNPDINNEGEIVWQQISGNTAGFPDEPWEIWSNIRGKLGDGQYPSINDAGEVVWQHWDGTDFEIYSSVRGQITFNEKADTAPQINNLGDIVWLQPTGADPIPEPSTIALISIWMLASLTRNRNRHW